MSNGAPTIATSGCHDVELFDLGQERPVPERREARVGQVELLGHAGRQVALRRARARGPCVTVPLAGKPVRRNGCQRRAQLRRESPLGPVVGGDHDVDVVAAHRGLLFGVRGCAAAHVKPNVKLVDPMRAHCTATRTASRHRTDARIVDLAVHDLHVVAGGDQTRVRDAEMVEESGARLVEPGEVVAVEHHALLVDLRVARHHRQRKHAHPLTVMSGPCRTLTSKPCAR